MNAPAEGAESSARTLDQIAPGEEVVVTRFQAESAAARRLMELGLVPGTPVTLVRVAPLGDPLEVSVRGMRLSLRRAEASQIRVAPR